MSKRMTTAGIRLDRQERRSIGTCSEHVRSEHVRNNAETFGTLFAVISKAVHQYLKSRADHHYGGSIVKTDTPFTIVISITNCYSFHNNPCWQPIVTLFTIVHVDSPMFANNWGISKVNQDMLRSPRTTFGWNKFGACSFGTCSEQC